MSFICPECNRKFDNKYGLANHKKWHNPEFRDNFSKSLKIWNNQIHDFFLNFLQKHTFFSNNLLVRTYADKMNLFGDKLAYDKKELHALVRHFKYLKIVSIYSSTNNKIDKDKLREYIELSDLPNGKRN